MIRTRSFRSIVSRYEAVFLDAYGVLKNYNGLIPGINHTLAYLEEKNIEYLILTNDASRSPERLAHSYQAKGLMAIQPEKIISSGMLAREYLRFKVKTGTLAYLGTESSAHYVEDLGLHLVPISQVDLDDCEDINALALLDDEGFDWNHDINKAINLLRRRNISVVVANTDEAYPVSRERVAIAIGGIADMMEDITGRRFIRFGKPDAQMFMFAYERLTRHRAIDRNRILMVGDTLRTDIIGGNKFGLDTALVLTGNTLPEQAEFLIQSTGIVPTYVCESALVE